jgi:hypothetical protein
MLLSEPHSAEMQVPYRLDPKISEEGIIRGNTEAAWRGFWTTRQAKRGRGDCGASDGKVRSHAGFDSAERRGGQGSESHIKQKRESYRKDINGAGSEFYPAALLNRRLFSIDPR